MSHRGLLVYTLVAATALAAAPAIADPPDDRRDHRGDRGRDDDDDEREWREWRGPHSPIQITGYGPRGGPPGTVVTITGSGFIKQTRVFVGGQRVRKDSWDPGRITFRIPDELGDGQLVLRQPGPFNDIVVGRLERGRWDDHERALAITGFTPDAGPPGTRVSIEGRFGRGDVFSFNRQALQVLDWDPGRVTVVIPPGARDDVFVVSRPRTGQQAVSPGRFRVGFPAPFVSRMTPAGGPPGTRVRLDGGGFMPDDVVTYGRIPAQILSRSGAHLDVVVPREAQQDSPFVVRGPRGEVSTQPFQLDVVRVVLADFRPAAGGPGTRVVLRGGRFFPGDDVLLGNVQVQVYELRESEIVLVIPEGARTGPFALRRRGQLVAQTAQPFQVVYLAPPVIGRFEPGGGPPGSQVRILGDNFTPDTRVAYDGQALQIVERRGDRELTVVVPGNARRPAPFVVANRAGETRSGAHFQLYTPAMVDSVSPTSGAWGTTVTIQGRNFRGDEVFYLADRPLENLDRRPERFTVRIPPGTQSGQLSFDSAGQRIRTPFRFDVQPVAIVESFAPRNGPPGTQVTIRGQFLGQVAAVSYGNLPCAILRRGRELVVEIPRGAGGADYLNLDGPGGRTRTPEPFRVYMPLPQVSSFSPEAAELGAQVTIFGANFGPQTRVWFNGIACDVVSRGPERMVFVVPPNARGRGPLVITHDNEKIVTGRQFTVLVPQPPPPPPPPPPPQNDGHHEHAHEHPHGDGGHHHHPHVHPHRNGDTHHHPF